jgi:hypothetical protein
MSDILKQLKEKYDNTPVNEIINGLLLAASQMKNMQREMVLGLFYMERTMRWREYPGYKTSSWERFLDDVFKMRTTTYRNMVFAFQSFPDEAKLYSVGLIIKIKETCGIERLPHVLREIKTADDSLTNPIKRERIEKIVQKYALPKAPAKAEDITDWRQRYLAEHDIRLALERENEKLRKRLKALISSFTWRYPETVWK